MSYPKPVQFYAEDDNSVPVCRLFCFASFARRWTNAHLCFREKLFLVPSNVSDLLWIKYVFHKFANYCIRFLIVGSLPYNLKYLDGDLSPYTVIKIELNWICILHSIPFGIVICVQLKVLHALHFLPFISFSMQKEYCYSHTVRCKSLEPNNSITKVKNNT